MTVYRLKKNLQDRMTDGSMIMLIAAALAILAMGHPRSTAGERETITAAASVVASQQLDASCELLPR